MKILLLLSSLVCFASLSVAQSPQDGAAAKPNPPRPKLPDGPLLRAVGEFAQWEVTYSYPEERQKKDKELDPSVSSRPRKVVTTKTGRITHEEQTDVSNHVTQNWSTGMMLYYKTPASALWYEARPGAGGGAQLPPPSGFRGVEMIQESNYVGTIANGKGTCLVFAPGGSQKGDASNLQQGTKWMETADIIAYVDADSRLPIAVREHGILRTYQYDSAPTQMQVLPTDLADQIKHGEEGRARLNAMAARPY